MCRLIETIRFEDGKLQNISFHNERFNRSRKELFGINHELDLEKFIEIPSLFSKRRYTCRILFSNEIISLTFSEYSIKTLKTVRIVEDDNIEYAYKFYDRSRFDKLKSANKSDDILIIKNGFVTDTSYANSVFWDGVKWITPSTPLLKGTMRSKLLNENKIHEDEIRKSDIKLFKSARIINAMIGLEESPDIKTGNIF
jgi:4-amino-4-deoxychorismate lyase